MIGQTVVKTVVLPLMTMVTVVVVVCGGARVVLLWVGWEVSVMVVWDGADPVLLWVGRVLLWDLVEGGGAVPVLLWDVVVLDVVVLDVTGMVVLL